MLSVDDRQFELGYTPIACGLMVTVVACVLSSVLAALWFRRYRLARVAVGLQVSLIFWGWAMAQYPFLLPPNFTVSNSAAEASTLRLTLIALLVGAVILLPSLWYLFQIFKTVPADPGERTI